MFESPPEMLGLTPYHHPECYSLWPFKVIRRRSLKRPSRSWSMRPRRSSTSPWGASMLAGRRFLRIGGWVIELYLLQSALCDKSGTLKRVRRYEVHCFVQSKLIIQYKPFTLWLRVHQVHFDSWLLSYRSQDNKSENWPCSQSIWPYIRYAQ